MVQNYEKALNTTCRFTARISNNVYSLHSCCYLLSSGRTNWIIVRYYCWSIFSKMKNAVLYKGVWLAKTSMAYALYDAKSFEALDKHLKQLDQNERELLKRYEKVSN